MVKNGIGVTQVEILDNVIFISLGTNLLVWFRLVSLFNGISTLFRLFSTKAILLEEQ